MEIIFKLAIEKLPEGLYLATSKDIPGLVAQGRSLDETIEIAKDVARKLYESYIEDGEQPPFPLVDNSHLELDMAIPVGA